MAGVAAALQVSGMWVARCSLSAGVVVCGSEKVLAGCPAAAALMLLGRVLAALLLLLLGRQWICLLWCEPRRHCAPARSCLDPVIVPVLLPWLPPCRRIMWVDSKKIRVSPGKLKVIGRRNKLLEVVEHPNISTSGKCVTLNYYACVNAVLGPVAIRFVTGTTGLRRRYKVRTSVKGSACVVAAASCPPPPNAQCPRRP